MACLFVYIKPSINASDLSIFRSNIRSRISSYLRKAEQKQQILSKNTLNTTLEEKIPCHGCYLGCDSVIMGMIPWLQFCHCGIRDINDRERCNKCDIKRVKCE